MAGQAKLWHVALTVAGDPVDEESVRAAMLRLRDEHAFLHSIRYDERRAELCYWEQATEMLDAAAMAMRVWTEHRESAALPSWDVVGLEVLDQSTYHRRSQGEAVAPAVGSVAAAPVRF